MRVDREHLCSFIPAVQFVKSETLPLNGRDHDKNSFIRSLTFIIPNQLNTNIHVQQNMHTNVYLCMYEVINIYARIHRHVYAHMLPSVCMSSCEVQGSVRVLAGWGGRIEYPAQISERCTHCLFSSLRGVRYSICQHINGWYCLI